MNSLLCFGRWVGLGCTAALQRGEMALISHAGPRQGCGSKQAPFQSNSKAISVTASQAYAAGLGTAPYPLFVDRAGMRHGWTEDLSTRDPIRSSTIYVILVFFPTVSCEGRNQRGQRVYKALLWQGHGLNFYTNCLEYIDQLDVRVYSSPK